MTTHKGKISPMESHWVYKAHLWAGPCPTVDGPAQMNSVEILEGGVVIVLTHNALSGLFFSLQVYCLQNILYTIQFPILCFYGIYMCASVSASGAICVSCAFSSAQLFCLILVCLFFIF